MASPSPSEVAPAEAGEGGPVTPEDQAGSPTESVAPSPSTPSSSSRRMRPAADKVWPEPFVEALALQVAADAAADHGRLAAAPAVATLFQVCSTWHAASRSDLLWHNLTDRIWSSAGNVASRRLATWQADYARRHRIASNFRAANSLHTAVTLPDASPELLVRRLALSDDHLAVGFSDGSVRLFHLPSTLHLATYGGPRTQRDLLGPFSRAISGLLLVPGALVFASQDGDIQVVSTGEGDATARHARRGNIVEDGTLVDFTGHTRWWAGLFAGIPGRSLRVWRLRSSLNPELVYVGSAFTDAESVRGWRMLMELPVLAVGRVRMTDADSGTVIACTSSGMHVVDVDGDVAAVVARHEMHCGLNVEAVDAWDGQVLAVDARGAGRVLNVAAGLEEVCRFSVTAAAVMAGCINGGYAVVSCGGRVRVWDAFTGDYLYAMEERVGRSVGTVAANHRYVVAWAGETDPGLLHLWDMGIF